MKIPTLRALLHRAYNRVKLMCKPEGVDGLQKLGHRAYVGGRWEDIGRLQFEFVRDQGVEPQDTLLDIGCGSLRAGVHLIPYLEPGRYWGLDKHEALIRRGIEEELDELLLEEKRPRFIVSETFELDRLEDTPRSAIAVSVFTHLPIPMIRLCLSRLRPLMPDGQLLATIFETRRPVPNPREGHDHVNFLYSVSQMRELARETGWRLEYIGDWGHPRGQKMLRFTPGIWPQVVKNRGGRAGTGRNPLGGTPG